MLPRGRYLMPLLKFLENLEEGESIDFGTFDVAKFHYEFEIYFKNQMVKYKYEELSSHLNDEGILVDDIMALDLSTLSMKTRTLHLKSERNLKNKVLKVITDNKMDFELTSEDGTIINGFIRDFDDSGQFKWFGENNKCYSDLELKFVESDTLQVLGDGKILYEFQDGYVNVYNVAYRAI